MYTVKEIHADFYEAEERLFVEAVGLQSRPMPPKKLAERYRDAGFGNVKPVKTYLAEDSKRKSCDDLIQCIEYFRVNYPNYKFITETEVKKLCEKYSLLLGEASKYTGDMPEKNLIDVENFKLKKEDWIKRYSHSSLMSYFESAINDYISGSSNLQHRIAYGVDPYSVTMPQRSPSSTKEEDTEQPKFKICAPKEDFNTLGYEIKDGYKLVYDPIVLQPVYKNGIEGYLIITAWGDESSDEIVVNETMN